MDGALSGRTVILKGANYRHIAHRPEYNRLLLYYFYDIFQRTLGIDTFILYIVLSLINKKRIVLRPFLLIYVDNKQSMIFSTLGNKKNALR